MKNLKSIGTALLVLAGTLPGLRGQDFRTDINPALIYYRSFLMAPDPLSHDDSRYLGSKADLSQPLPDRFDAIVAGYNKQFVLIRQAAHSTVPCDWGIDWSAGSETLLPQLARLKGLAQTARLRARWDLQHNRPADAGDDLAAAFAMGRNASRDGSLIAVLVQAAMENIVFATVAENFSKFPPGTLAKLAEAMDAAPARGTVASAMVLEKSMHNEWLPNRILELQKENPGNDAKVLDIVSKIFISSGDGAAAESDTWRQIVAAAGGTSDGIIRLVHDMEPLATQMAELMALPLDQFEAQTNQFEAAIRNSSNPLVKLLMPAVANSRSREFSLMETEAMMQAAIAYKLNGAAGLNSVADPCGQGPFQMQRFVFEGTDRGFELTGAYSGRGYPEAMIFLERDGAPVHVYGVKAGQAVTE